MEVPLHVSVGTVVRDAAVGEEQDVVEEVVHLRLGLQQRHHDRRVGGVRPVCKGLHDGERGCGVQPCTAIPPQLALKKALYFVRTLWVIGLANV